MLVEYIDRALSKAKYEILEDGWFLGTVRGLRGVWANARTLESCRDDLAETLEGWVLFRIANGMSISAVDGIRIVVGRVPSEAT